jgi:type II secretory pathway pseudopilin PulG
MTLVEILTVIGIIAVLLAILLPGLSVVRRNGLLTESQSNLRQIFVYWTGYATDNREFVVPSQFDYREAAYPGKVRANSPKGVEPLIGPLGMGNPGTNSPTNVGTWTDILWTYSDMPPLAVSWNASVNPEDYNYRYDSPDRIVYTEEISIANPFRSTVMMERTADGSEMTPFGTGAQRSEVGHPGYFAANDYLNAVPSTDFPQGRWFSRGQIRFPDKSVFLIDSLAGETIAPTEEAFGCLEHGFETEVDFRYIGDNALILTFEGGVHSEPEFKELEDIESRGYRIHDLEQRVGAHSHP